MSLSSRSEEHTSELQSHSDLVCRLLLEKKERVAMSRCKGQLRFDRVVPSFRSGEAARSSRRGREGNRSFFFFNDPAPTEIYTLSLHDALPFWLARSTPIACAMRNATKPSNTKVTAHARSEEHTSELPTHSDLVCLLLLEK